MTNNSSNIFNSYYTSYNTSTTTNVTFSNNVMTYNYTIPYNAFNDIYDIDYSSIFTRNINGVWDYMHYNDLFEEISNILYEESLSCEDLQDFEDKIYGHTLDLLCEYLSNESTFVDILNEDSFSYQEVNKIIYKVIDCYREKCLQKEY